MLGLITLAGLGAMCMGNPPRRRKRRNPSERYRIGGHRKTMSFDEAKRKAAEIHRRTGIFVSIEKARRNPSARPGENEIPTVRITKSTKRNPLKKGSSRETIARNIHELIRSGWTHKKAVAVALRTAGVARRNPDVWDRFAAERARQIAAGTWKAPSSGYASTATMPNPKKRKGKKSSWTSPGTAASRLAHWRWHHNPGEKFGLRVVARHMIMTQGREKSLSEARRHQQEYSPKSRSHKDWVAIERILRTNPRK